MRRTGPVSTILTALLAALLCIAGCATADRKVVLDKEPIAQTAAVTSVIYLAPTEKPAFAPGDRPKQNTKSDISNKEGEKPGSERSDASLADLVMRAFAEELKNAGYSVVLVNRIPVDAAKGITLGSVKMTPNETSSPIKNDAGGRVGFVAELWKNGKVFASLDYSTMYRNKTVSNKEPLSFDTMQFFLDRSVQETIGLFEQR